MPSRKDKDNLVDFKNQFKHQPKNNHHRHSSGTNLVKKLRKISLKNYLIAIVTIIIIFLAYLFSPIGHVQKISVSGVNYLGEQQVINASGINHDSLVLNTLVHKKKIEQNIKKKVPLIKDVSYHYNGFNNLDITVKEYKTAGFVIKNNGYYRVLENNHVIKPKLSQPIGNFPIYQTFGKKTPLTKIIKLYVSLPSKLRNDISEIHGSTSTSKYPYQIKIYMNDGNIVIGDIRTINSKLKYYPSIARQLRGKNIINMEIGVYSKPIHGKNGH